jgi:hypothetical protein
MGFWALENVNELRKIKIGRYLDMNCGFTADVGIK